MAKLHTAKVRFLAKKMDLDTIPGDAPVQMVYTAGPADKAGNRAWRWRPGKPGATMSAVLSYAEAEKLAVRSVDAHYYGGQYRHTVELT